MINSFLKELKIFSKQNWWVWLILPLMIWLCFKYDNDGSERIYAEITVLMFHLIADILIMMMLSSYAIGDRISMQNGTYYQIASFVLFFLLKLYQGEVNKEWHYILGDPLYILAAILNYRTYILKKKTPWFNLKMMFFLLIVCLILSYFSITSNVEGINSRNLITFVQAIGIYSFAVALSILDHPKLQIRAQLFALSLMVGGSIAKFIHSLRMEMDSVSGLEMSYIILPGTVLVFLIQNSIKNKGRRKKINTSDVFYQ
ncbi:hypothetical protein [Aquimarina litoralis]|uniref:hypothetical protein n=1 Tax=Aquimarina litoralis TaxID=584605 RepID=UPI001C55F024|nr:hypothetical protein [Aquimarina litoralis]MBW1295413.1 hypothetical protein [Aquimarina litoralis]